MPSNFEAARASSQWYPLLPHTLVAVPRTPPWAARLDYGAGALRGARYVGPANVGTIGADIVLKLPNERSLQAYAAAVSDPKSRIYRHFLTPVELGAAFGAPLFEYLQVAQYFSSLGLSTRGWPQRQLLRIYGPQSRMERALGTKFGWFRKGGELFYAPLSVPRTEIPLPIASVSHLVASRLYRRPFRIVRSFHRLTSGFGNNLLNGFSPYQIASAFDYTGAWNAGFTGKGITIGVIGTGPISPADVPAYKALYGIPGAGTVTQINVTTVAPGYSNGLQTPPPVTPPCHGVLPGCNPEDFEAQLDTEQMASLAPDARVLFYLAYNPHECYPDASGACRQPPQPEIGITELDDEIQQAIADNAADVISISVGTGELDAVGGPFQADGSGLQPTEYASLAAEGVATFVASGDDGAEECQQESASPNADKLCVSYPASDVNVVAVGGTTTPIGSSGRLTGPLTAWGLQTSLLGGAGASGGGVSAFFARPAYQDVVANVVGGRRGTPDVSGNADIVTGDAVLVNYAPGLGGALLGSIGGTSAATPDVAAMWALVLQACKGAAFCGRGPSAHPYRFGLPNSLLYAAYAKPALYRSSFYDIIYGDNALCTAASTLSGNCSALTLDPGYKALPGYDLASGIGAPFARNLLHAITGL